MIKPIAMALISTLSLMATSSYATDLVEVYQQAAAHNATYQSALATYQAAKYGVPISRAALLPAVSLSANTTANYEDPNAVNHYNTHGYTLTLTQPIFDFGDWKAYTQAEYTLKQAAVTYAQAQQTLIMSVASSYFAVLEAQDQLRYAQKNETSLKEQMNQTEQQYKVGLKALTDVESTRASYESAIASTISAQNDLHNSIEALTVVTGQPEGDLAPLESNFPLIKPQPSNSDTWVQFGLQHNLDLESAELEAQIEKLGIDIAKAGTAATPGYLPTVTGTGTYGTNKDNSNTNGNVTTASASLGVTWDLFNSGETYATVKQADYTYQASAATLEETRRSTISSVRQSYLNILSDISQVQALNQAVISGESSLNATRQAYLVGTRTIVDVLTQQSNLFQSQQEYATAIYTYINDSLSLKQNAGTLNQQDIAAINQWLVHTPAKKS
ncbi:MAG: type secretion protein TolC [Gammaproteobacteria bacterium]|jgi:outer membrane protein|nr:type secretion protein TolC [Gammaproteobacteria bacterium]